MFNKLWWSGSVSVKGGVFCGGLVLLALTGPMGAQTQERCPIPGATDGIAAMVAGDPITVAEVDAHVGVKLSRVRSEEYQLRSKALSVLIEARLLEREAARRGVAVEALLGTADAPPTVEERAWAKRLYDALPVRFGGTPESLAMAEITNGFAKQRQTAARAKLIASLSTSGSVHRKLLPYRLTIETAGDPALGNADAPVTIVEFSDYQCPYCKSAATVLNDTVRKYPGKVRLVYKHYPLQSIHKEAAKAAEAASCANEQGKFWEMSDRLFANPQSLQTATLKAYARDLGLNAGAFDKCLDDGKHAATWQKHVGEGNLFGVSGTPTVFVNGRVLVGGVSPRNLDDMIEEELALQPRARAATAAAVQEER
jgi:protein-disulfide isomerase